MQIAAIQKHSLVDFPGVISCVVFTYGCNLRCWYCHNHWLVLPNSKPKVIETAEVLNFLTERIGWLDGVVVSGGEPTLHPDLPHFIRLIKQLGFQVKLDTNGTNPEMVRHLIDAGLVDFVAMDVKALPTAGNYTKIIGVPDVDIVEQVKQTIAILKSSKVQHQYRITWPSDKPKLEITTIEHFLNGYKLHVNELTLENGILADYLT